MNSRRRWKEFISWWESMDFSDCVSIPVLISMIKAKILEIQRGV
jgi:hypothetical protein